MSQIEEDLMFINNAIADSINRSMVKPWGRICDYIKESQKTAYNKQSTPFDASKCSCTYTDGLLDKECFYCRVFK